MPLEMYINLRRIFYGIEDLTRLPHPHIPQHVLEESDEKFHLKSLLSVIADSGIVEAYILTKQDMSYIPDTTLKKVFEKIALCKDPDRPYTAYEVEEMKENMTRWEEYKSKAIDRLLAEQRMDRNK